MGDATPHGLTESIALSSNFQEKGDATPQGVFSRIGIWCTCMYMSLLSRVNVYECVATNACVITNVPKGKKHVLVYLQENPCEGERRTCEFVPFIFVYVICLVILMYFPLLCIDRVHRSRCCKGKYSRTTHRLNFSPTNTSIYMRVWTFFFFFPQIYTLVDYLSF